ncbi:MAG: hypothetical protein ABL857_03245 [Rickettsiales bacterium]|jgi:hypothetical protein
MKIFISSLLLVLYAIIFTSSSHGAQKIRDMSLSIERTNRQLNVKSQEELEDESVPRGGLGGIGANPTSDDVAVFDREDGFDMNSALDPNMAKQMRDINARNNMGSTNLQGVDLGFGSQNNQYMGLGQQSEQSLLGNGIPLANGLPPQNRGSNKQNIMNVFCSSKYKMQTNISNAEKVCINAQRQQACERFKLSAMNVRRILSQIIDCEANITGYNISGCDGLNSNRINLLKQYWQDETTSYTILFLPDMVLNTAANCAASTKYGTTK